MSPLPESETVYCLENVTSLDRTEEEGWMEDILKAGRGGRHWRGRYDSG